ncbi:MAG: hypothetical protein ABRQ31_00490 [Smithellaceae bacterium]
MAGKIFYRDRLKVGTKEKKPRFKLIAVADVSISFYAKHLKKKELEDIAASVGAELVLLKPPQDGTIKDEEIEVKE